MNKFALTVLLLVAVSASEEQEKTTSVPGLSKITLQRNEGHVNLHSQPQSQTRARRDMNFPELKKPTHQNVVIPNWNPNVKTQPWQVIRIKARNKRSPRSVEVASQEKVFHSPSSVEEIKESELRIARSAEEMSSHQVEALSHTSQEKMYRSTRSAEDVASQEKVFHSPSSAEEYQESELRIARSAEEMSSHQVEALLHTSQEKVYRSPRSVEQLTSQEAFYRSPRSVEELASQETVIRNARSVELA